MEKLKILKNKITGKYFCSILTTSDYRDHNKREEHYYDVDELRSARTFASSPAILLLNTYMLIDYNTELRRLKIEKINEKL